MFLSPLVQPDTKRRLEPINSYNQDQANWTWDPSNENEARIDTMLISTWKIAKVERATDRRAGAMAVTIKFIPTSNIVYLTEGQP